MMFTSEGEEFSMVGILDRFGGNLPIIVKVTQGFCGEIVEDTFDQNQIIRLHTISRQKRVVAKAHIRGEFKYFSIPLNYQNMKLCIVDAKGKVAQEKDLEEIIKHTKRFPVKVRFPKDQLLTVGSQHIGTNQLPCLELTQTFDEIYFLGNTVFEDKMSEEVIHVPLYLLQLRMCIVKGISGKPQETWEHFQASLSKAAEKCVYKTNYGNPEMAEYHAASFVETSDDLYSYITPTLYYNILPSIADNTASSSSKHHSVASGLTNQTYTGQTRSFDLPPSEPKLRATSRPASNVYEMIGDPDIKPKPEVKHKPDVARKRMTLDQAIAPNPPSLRPRVPDMKPKPEVKHKPDVARKRMTMDQAIATNPPRLPPRVPFKPVPIKHGSDEKAKDRKSRHYENNLPRGHVAPLFHGNSSTSTAEEAMNVQAKPKEGVRVMPSDIAQFNARNMRSQEHAVKDQIKEPVNIAEIKDSESKSNSNRNFDTEKTGDNVKDTPQNILPEIHGSDDVFKLTIDEVSKYLKVLGLEAYAEEFRAQQVDGILLSDLDRDILRDDFGMKAIEATRLMKFVTKGHVPK